MKMKIAYLRVSSDEQRERQTIETQRADVQKFCDKESVKLDKTYEDDGVSGTIPLARREPGGSALMRDAEAGLIGEIYVLKFDRLGRNLRKFLNLFHRLERLGVAVRSITQPLPEGATGRMMMQIWGVIAEWDRENILATTLSGLKREASEGNWTGGSVPFGYRNEAGRLALHEANAELVRNLFKMAAEGKTGQALADYLNDQRVPTSRQNPGSIWRTSSVRVVITNAIYTGTRQWGRRQMVKVEDDAGNVTKHLKLTPERVIESKCPVIVPPELWEKANAKLHSNQIVAMAHPKNDYLLHGLITCGICGSKYGGRGYCYACRGRSNARRLYGQTRPPCPARHAYRAEREDTVWGLCEAYISTPDEAVEEIAREMEREAAPARKVEDELRKEEEKLARNSAAREKARIMYQEGWASKEEFQKDMQRLTEQRSTIEARVAKLRQLSTDRQSRVRDCVTAGSGLEQLRPSEYTFADKRRIVEALVAGVAALPTGECRIDLRFHCEAPGWPHGV